MAKKIAESNQGTDRKRTKEYQQISAKVARAKKKARKTGDWTRYKALRKDMFKTQAKDPQDPDYRRLHFVRYADDWLAGVIGSKADAVDLKKWLETYLKEELQLELSAEKTLITNSKRRVRFLGYDIKRWAGERIYRFRTKAGQVITKRTGTYQLRFLMPRDKTMTFAKQYGDTRNWHGKHRNSLLRLSELEILMMYNAEIRGFLGYYALADNLVDVADKVLWLTTSSFFRTLAGKRQSSVKKVAKSLKRGAGRYVMTLQREGKPTKEYELVSSTRQLKREASRSRQIDLQPNTWMYRNRTELGKRLLAHQCEWCGTKLGQIEVHHVRKLGNLKGKVSWERQMIQRHRKTMILCAECHDELHAGTLSEKKKSEGKTGEPSTLKGVRAVRRGVQ